MSNLSDNDIEYEIILLQQKLDTAVASKDFLLASNLQDDLNKRKAELEVDQQRKAVKLSFIDDNFPLASEIYKISYDTYRNAIIEALETKYSEDIKVTMSLIGMFISKSALYGHSLVSFSSDKDGTRIAYEDGRTINLDSEWTKNALAKIESYERSLKSNKEKAFMFSQNENEEALKEYFQEKISFIESLNLDDVILRSVKEVFASQELLTILKCKLVEMKYLVGESELERGLGNLTRSWLVVSLWPVRNVSCKCTFLKSVCADPSVFLYQKDSDNHNLLKEISFANIINNYKRHIIWYSDRIGQYKEESDSPIQ